MEPPPRGGGESHLGGESQGEFPALGGEVRTVEIPVVRLGGTLGVVAVEWMAHNEGTELWKMIFMYFGFLSICLCNGVQLKFVRLGSNRNPCEFHLRRQIVTLIAYTDR